MPPKRETPTSRPSLKAKPARSQRFSATGTAYGQVTEIQRARMIAAMIDTISERGRSKRPWRMSWRARASRVAPSTKCSRISKIAFWRPSTSRSHGQREYVLEVYDPAAKWRTRIRAALIGLLEFLEDEPAMGRLCILETLGAGPQGARAPPAVLDW